MLGEHAGAAPAGGCGSRRRCSASDIGSKSGRLARSSAIFSRSASRSVSSGAEKTHPEGLLDRVGLARILIAVHRLVRRHARHLAPQGVVHLLGGHPRDADGEDTGHRSVEVAVAAEAPDDLVVVVGELVEAEGTEPNQGLTPPRLGAPLHAEAPGGRRHRPREHLADVPAGPHRVPRARLRPSQIQRSGRASPVCACPPPGALGAHATTARGAVLARRGGRGLPWPSRAVQGAAGCSQPTSHPTSTRPRATSRPQEEPHDEP